MNKDPNLNIFDPKAYSFINVIELPMFQTLFYISCIYLPILSLYKDFNVDEINIPILQMK